MRFEWIFRPALVAAVFAIVECQSPSLVSWCWFGDSPALRAA